MLASHLLAEQLLYCYYLWVHTVRLLILGSFTDASIAMMSVMHSHLSRPTSAAAETQQEPR